MYFYAHAGLGWILAEAGRGDSRFRRAVFLAAIAPDLDALPSVLGWSITLNHHHVWTHNLLFSLVVSALAMWYCPGQRLRALVFTQIAFYSHFFGDYFFTTWPLSYLFPFSRCEFISDSAFHLWHPVNQWLGLGFTLGALVLCVVFRRTPLEVLSPRADTAWIKVVTKLFRARGVRRMNP
ncbi:MAG: metal-dependent hydrolase [Verrucomicrobia bacterium]|nr:metal-dependent hydrolase [Verrucomicrobiota bacterium]MBU1909537.1 metal-dependent hydrolase [Verrucomicrobiota bacterium]